MLIVVPDDDFAMISALLSYRSSVVVVKESELLGFEVKQKSLDLQYNIDGYAVQMAIKILVARLVTSDYYLTLDADVITTRTFNEADLFHKEDLVHYQNNNNRHHQRNRTIFKAKYTPESQEVHPHWWRGAANTLKYHRGYNDDDTHRAHFDYSPDPKVRFGVTPALLSTMGSMLTLSRLSQVFALSSPSSPSDEKQTDQSKSWIERWLMKWGDGFWWSEYTLYSLTLNHHKLFDTLHAPSSRLGGFGSSFEEDFELSCRSTWFAPDQPWSAASVFRPENSPPCPFTVLQSSSGVEVSYIAALVKHELTYAQKKLERLFNIQPSEFSPHYASIFSQKPKV
jgi:hypothetical protein